MVRRVSAKDLLGGSIPPLASNLIMNLKKNYIFTTNHDDKIEIEAYFEEEAIMIFQEKYQRIGTKYYHPTVFTKLKDAKMKYEAIVDGTEKELTKLRGCK